MKMKTVMVRYRARPECADDNEALIAKVFESLGKAGPADVHYRVMREAGGNVFVHLSTRPEGAQGNPLMQNEAFREFVSGVKARCEEPPVDLSMRLLGEFKG